MKIIFSLALSLCSFSAFSIPGEWIPPYSLLESVVDSNLSANQAIFRFNFQGINYRSLIRSVDLSIDGKASTMKLIDNEYIEITTTPGNHIFQFFYSVQYLEIYTDSLLIKPKHRDTYNVFMQESMSIQVTEKPVIYLYPTEETDVSLKLRVKGQISFTYPPYNEGWEFTASPDGNLTFGENNYNYLFWESRQHYSIPSIELKSGFIVKGSESLNFLEEKLTIAGLNSEEQADFITYWGPRLASYPQCYVRFEFNSSCNRFAELEISPKPDKVYRIYMLWFDVPASFTTEKEQEIIPIKREGFTVLEWGGQELKLLNKSITSDL